MGVNQVLVLGKSNYLFWGLLGVLRIMDRLLHIAQALISLIMQIRHEEYNVAPGWSGIGVWALVGANRDL